MQLLEKDIYNLSKEFAIRIVNLYKYLKNDKQEYVMSKQILRSGTSIGANIYEGKYAQSKPDFITKMSIALKESNETSFWLEILNKTEYITEKEYTSINDDCEKIKATLINIVKNSKIGN